MGERRQYKLGDLFEIQNGYAFKSGDYVDNGNDTYEVLKMGHIEKGGGLRRLPKQDYITKSEKLKPWVLDKNDIVMAMTDMKDNVVILGVPAMIDKSNHYVLNQRVARLKLKKNASANVNYLFNYLKWEEFLFDLQSKANSGVQVNLTTETIKNSIVSLPSKNEQDSIANILINIDNKINLLQNNSNTLEKLAQSFFKQYFLTEQTEGWEIMKLGQIAEVQNGYAFSSRDYVEYLNGHLEVLKMGHIEKGGGLRLNPKKDFVPRSENLKRWILNKGDIIMAMTDMKDNVVILGVPAMIDVDDKYVLNQRVARIYLKSSEHLINNYLLYIQLKDDEFIANIQSKANSGVQVNLSTETIKDSEIIIPPKEFQNTTGKLLSTLYLKKELNDAEIKTLIALRNTLLPKLMSGEVTVEP